MENLFTHENGEAWDTTQLVDRLRAIRNQSLDVRQRGDNPPRLPSRKVLKRVIDNLAMVLFPNRLGEGDLGPDLTDHFVGITLSCSLRLLLEQVQRELHFVSNQEGKPGIELQNRAKEMTQQFAATLPALRIVLDSDLQAAYEGDPAACSVDEVLVCYPGISAILHYRLAHELYRLGAPLVARIIAEIAHSKTGIDIHPGALIGERFFIDHGTGVVIGQTCVIGNRVRLYQAVTLGAKRFPVDENGALIKGNARHPIVEDDVVIYAGATILGRITLGKGSVIGGNVWLTRSIPPGSNVSQAQTRQDLFTDGAGI